jgi:hypothetical protein
MLNENVAVTAAYSVAVAQAEELSSSCRLTCGEMDEEKQPLQELVNLLEVMIDH